MSVSRVLTKESSSFRDGKEQLMLPQMAMFLAENKGVIGDEHSRMYF